MRKVRKDSKLHGLAKKQRAMVDKWLFDKGLTYQEVSEACLQMFGLKVSKSSVGRYHERQAQGKVRRKKDEGRKGVNGEKTRTLEENYQECLRLMTKWALEELQWPVENERDIKTVLRFMRILISARRERNEADMTKLAWEKFEMKAARQCLRVMAERKGVRQPGVTSLNRETLQRRQRAWILTQRREERDPMMMWDFPDGRTKPAPTGGHRIVNR